MVGGSARVYRGVRQSARVGDDGRLCSGRGIRSGWRGEGGWAGGCWNERRGLMGSRVGKEGFSGRRCRAPWDIYDTRNESRQRSAGNQTASREFGRRRGVWRRGETAGTEGRVPVMGKK